MTALIEKFQQAETTGTIPDALMLHNGDETLDAFYWDIIKIGEGETQPGAELAAYWFMRNAKIFNKLVQVTRPGDRVLVVYGSGHRAWLTEMVERTSGFELVDPVPYIEMAQETLAEAAD